MLKVCIKKRFHGFCLDIALEHDFGCLGILGASGSGKSMTLKCIAGIEKPDEGYIAVNGRVLYDSRKKIDLAPRQRRVGYLFQNYALFPNMTVEENIRAAIQDRRTRQQRADIQIRRFLLEDLRGRYPGQLSGGQQQRVALARIMAQEPEMILLDEPFSAMDGYLKEKLQHEMMEFLKDYPGDVVLVSHSRDDIYRFHPDVAAIDDGSVIQTGSMWDVFLRPGNERVARLTGCNNISPVKRTGEYEVYAIDWDIRLTTALPVADDIQYVGIRSHDIRDVGISSCEIRAGAERDGSKNTFLMELMDMVDSPFEYRYHMRAAGSKAREPIWWKAYKDLSDRTAAESFPRNMQLPQEKLLLLK